MPDNVADFLKAQQAREATERSDPNYQGGSLGGTHYMQPTGDSNPDAFSSSFSRDSQRGNYTGFGPGDYSGDYTGAGDRCTGARTMIPVLLAARPGQFSTRCT